MNDQTVNNLRLKINTLDQLLISGLGIYNNLFNDYKDKSREEGFTVPEYQEKSLKEYYSWKKECVGILETLPRLHYLYHFVKPERPVGIHVIGLPDGLSNYKTYLEYQLVALEEIILRLEDDENLALRKEIADKEYQADILYQITYSTYTREIKLNNILIHKPDFDRENDRCFDFISKNANRKLTKQEIEEANGEPLKKELKHIVRDLGFTGDLVKVFFSGLSNEKIMFTNPITKQFAFKHDLPNLNLQNLRRNSEKK